MASTKNKKLVSPLCPRKYPLNVRHLLILGLLQEKKRISVSRMAKLFGVHRGTLHGLITGLVKHGLATYTSSWVIVNDKPVRVGYVHLVEPDAPMI